MNLAGKKRIVWLDIAKAFGIFLVFYGHLLETMYRYGGRPFLWPQLQFIYTFHMPLFFFLSGYLYRDKGQTFGRFFRIQFLTRLLPFFNVLSLSALLVQQAGRGGVDWPGVWQGCLALLRGTPSFNMLTWFLVCLFTVELIHFSVRRWFTTSHRLLAGVVAALVIGLPVARWAAHELAVNGVYFNLWYVQEALTAYAFYLMGLWGCRVSVLEWPWLKRKGFILGLCFMVFAVTWVSASWNQGPFATEPGLVLMSISSHGSFLWFPITAVTGIFFLIFLAKLVPVNRILLYFGQKTLILLGLGGLFFEFFNQPMVAVTNPYFPASPLVTTGQALLLTLISFVICVPFIYVFERYFPQLVGRPVESGPVLPRLM
jgi:acyltransferase